MTPAEVNRAVAAATGESVGTVRQRGFSIADPSLVDHNPEPYNFDPECEVLTGDALDTQRPVLAP
jgi:hypothetical protein